MEQDASKQLASNHLLVDVFFEISEASAQVFCCCIRCPFWKQVLPSVGSERFSRGQSMRTSSRGRQKASDSCSNEAKHLFVDIVENIAFQIVNMMMLGSRWSFLF